MGAGAGSVAEPLVCPACGSRYAEPERFCPACRLPLTLAATGAGRELGGDAAVPERHRRARKVKPQLTEGPLVRVAGARNQAEGEFIQALLLEEGVPSLLRRSAGFDVPDFLAAGPRDVLVPQAALDTAREVLLQAELIPAVAPASGRPAPARLLAGILAVLAIGLLVMWLLLTVLSPGA